MGVARARSRVTSSYPSEMAHSPAASLLVANWKVVLTLLLPRQKSTISPSHCIMRYWTNPGAMVVHGVMLSPTRSGLNSRGLPYSSSHQDPAR